MQAVKPFSMLANVYDAIMDDIDYEAWVHFVLETVKAGGWRGKRVLDLGCGTGNSSYPFFIRGLEVVGLDSSAEMLAVARGKLPPASFIEADFCDFELPEPFDLAVSIFDSLNNILEPGRFLTMAVQVFAHLNPGGIFMFDVNTTIGLKNLWESGRAEGWAGEVYYRWEHSFDDVTGLARVEAYCEDGRESFTEVHHERPYDAAELLEILSEAGFTRAEVLSFPNGEPAAEDAERIWVVAHKPG